MNYISTPLRNMDSEHHNQNQKSNTGGETISTQDAFKATSFVFWVVESWCPLSCLLGLQELKTEEGKI